MVAHSGKYEVNPKETINIFMVENIFFSFFSGKASPCHNAGELAVDMLALVFISLQEN